MRDNEEYRKVLRAVAQTGIKEGGTYDALVCFLESLDVLQDEMEILSNKNNINGKSLYYYCPEAYKYNLVVIKKQPIGRYSLHIFYDKSRSVK